MFLYSEKTLLPSSTDPENFCDLIRIIIPGGNALHLFPFMCHFLDAKPSDGLTGKMSKVTGTLN